MYFSTNNLSSPKLAFDSCVASLNPSATSESFLSFRIELTLRKEKVRVNGNKELVSYHAIRIPLPPPPADAFNIIGYPIEFAVVL